MKRLLLLLLALLLGTACSTLSTLNGAKTLDPGEARFSVALSLQHGSSPLSYGGFPVPEVEVAGRVGLKEDVDFGFRVYLLGAGFDVRYRFWHSARTHLAVAPGVSGLWLPKALTAQVGGGSLDVRAPLLGEVELGRKFSVMGGPQALLRDQWNSVGFAGGPKGSTARLDVFAGGGGRVEGRFGALVLGVSGDLFAQPVRHAGLSWSVGTDVGFRTR